MKVFLDLMWFFKQEKKSYLIGIFILLIVALITLIPPRIIGIIIDQIENNTLTIQGLLLWVGILIAVALVLYILRYYWRILIFGSAVKLGKQMRNKLYHKLTNLSQTFYQQRRVGDLMAHATNDIQAIQATAGSGVLTFVDSIATGGTVIIAMALTISWKLTLICLIPLPFMAILTSWYGTLLHKRFHHAQKSFSALNDKTQESITGMKVIKTFGQEKENIEDFAQKSENVVRKNQSVARIDALFDPTISLIVGISFFLTIAFGSKFVLAGELTIGQLVSFTTYLGLLVWPMLAFGWLFNIVERGRASNDRVNALLNEDSDQTESPNAINQTPTGDIVYEIKQFTFPGANAPVLNNIAFQIKRGETIGIVGKTGVGKTTLLKLLTREFECLDGEIHFGAKTLQQYTLTGLREAIGYVPQEHFLFSATVSDNIAFAHPDASEAEIRHAAKLACIDEDILQFTNGYQTIVGERGVALSGGQKQRISIARALLLNPEVLLLDDSLSAVDAKTEEKILKALRENRAEKTTIITSHRLSSIQHADLILVIEAGEIKEKGTHIELLEQDGWYKEMYLQQQLEKLVEKGG